MSRARLPGAARWQALARRIDALSLRERVFLFLSIAVVAVAVADTLVISPLLAAQREAAARVNKQAAELAALRQRLAVARTPAEANSPGARLRAELQALADERRTLEAALAGAGSAGSGPAPRLPDLLARVLQRHERLSLVRLDVAPAAPGAPGATPGGSEPAAGPRLQAVDLALQGSYLDLAAYLAEIEGQLPGLRWGPLQLGSGTEAPLLTLRVFLPGAPA